MGLVAQGRQHGAGRREQVVLARGGGELAQPRAQDEAALGVARDQAVVLQGDGDAVRRRAGQMGGADELGQGGRSRFEGAHDQGGLIDDSDAAALGFA